MEEEVIETIRLAFLGAGIPRLVAGLAVLTLVSEWW